jgi:exoribonuclease R
MNFINLFKAFIINKHQLAYEEANDTIDYLIPAFNVYRKFFYQKERLPSYNYIFNNDKLSNIYLETQNESHELIEFFMIKTNTAIAKYLLDRNILFPRRAHDKSTKIIKNLAQFPKKIQTYFQIISSPCAYYTTANNPHTDLQLEYYTHFTSPMRRYIDQIISRLLDGEFFTKEQLDDICTKANIQEKKIDAMIDDHFTIKINEYLMSNPIHEGVITHVSTWGIHVLLIHLKQTAQIHISKLSQGERLVYADGYLQGNNSFKLGQTIKVRANFDSILSWNAKL